MKFQYNTAIQCFSDTPSYDPLFQDKTNELLTEMNSGDFIAAEDGSIKYVTQLCLKSSCNVDDNIALISHIVTG